MPLSKDHNPSLKSEVKRIKENGGMIGYNERDALARSKRNWLCNALFSCCLDLKIGTPYIFPGKCICWPLYFFISNVRRWDCCVSKHGRSEDEGREHIDCHT